jgi:prolipoprotein diacylglyceryltransferase
MKIAISDQGIFFGTFYILSFAIIFVVVIVFSIRRKIPLRSILLMMTTMSLMTIIGSRLFTIPVTQWGQIIRGGSFEESAGRSAVGGLIFGLAGLVFSRKILGIGMPIINLYAWLAPVGFGIQKIGCFLNGCCYGKPSNLPWSVQYPEGTNIHFYQWCHGIIGENDSYSLSVHPVQIYEAIGLFLLSYIVWRTRNIWKKNWSILIFSLCLFFIFRFTTEFFRDPASTYFASRDIWGLKEFQWLLLLSGIICGMILLVFEKFIKISRKESELITPSLGKSITYIIVLSAIIYVFKELFTMFELVSLDIKFIPAILLTTIHVYKSIPKIRIRLATTSFLIFPLFMIFQTFPQDTIKSRKSIDNFYKNDVKSYTRIDIGTSFSNYYGDLAYNPQPGFCGNTYTHEDYRHDFRIGGIGVSKTKIYDKSGTTMGINLFGGVNEENNLTNNRTETYFLFGINPYIKYDRRWISLGAGVQAGNLRWIPIAPIDSYIYEEGTKFSPFMPSGLLRVGPKDILDLKYNFGFNFPSSFPVLTHELSVGSGFGSKTNFDLRLGLGLAKTSNYFISAEGLISKQFGLNLRYDYGNTYYFEHNSSWFILGAYYRFGFTY